MSYRSDFNAMVARREALLTELQDLDIRLFQMATVQSGCYIRPGSWARRRIRKAWAVIAKYAPWHDKMCKFEHYWEPCSKRCQMRDDSLEKINLPSGASVNIRPLGGAFPQPPPMRVVKYSSTRADGVGPTHIPSAGRVISR